MEVTNEIRVSDEEIRRIKISTDDNKVKIVTIVKSNQEMHSESEDITQGKNTSEVTTTEQKYKTLDVFFVGPIWICEALGKTRNIYSIQDAIKICSEGLSADVEYISIEEKVFIKISTKRMQKIYNTNGKLIATDKKYELGLVQNEKQQVFLHRLDKTSGKIVSKEKI